jgi:hypothetical protein
VRGKIMATITNAKLAFSHDHEKKLVKAVVTCDVNFTGLEQCQMKTCPKMRYYKLKCQLWGSDSGLTGSDDFLYTYSDIFYFPDPTPTPTEKRTFDVMLGEGVLDEDWGEDEVYGLLSLSNLYTMTQITKKTNTIHHSF